MAISFNACSSKGLKESKGILEKLAQDSVTVNIDGQSVKLSSADLHPSSIAILPGDSVKIYYVGQLSSDKARVMLLSLIPAKSKVVNVGYDENKELMTADHEADNMVSND